MDEDFIIADNVLADTLGDPDNMPEHVAITNPEGATDYIIVSRVTKDGDSVSITGESLVTGDSAYYILSWDVEVSLWLYA